MFIGNVRIESKRFFDFWAESYGLIICGFPVIVCANDSDSH